MTVEPIHVLWIYGPPGVGKTTTGWELWAQLSQAGIRTGYVDTDQLGICVPAHRDDPGGHRMKAANLAAVVSTFRSAGARCVVVTGVADPQRVREHADQVPGAAITLCRLRVDHDELRKRLAERGWHRDLVAEAIREATALDGSADADLSLDTTGLSVAEVIRRLRQQVGDWPSRTPRVRSHVAMAGGPEEEFRAVDVPPARVLWLCGATGVGKSSVGWRILMDSVHAGVPTGYVDLEQVGFLRPAPADDPDNHRIKAGNLAALWRTFHASGARRLIVVGQVDDPAAVRVYRDVLPAASLRLVRLHANRAELGRRIARRGRGDGPRIPGDRLSGLPAHRLRQIADEAAATAARLAVAGIGDVCVDTDGRTVEEIARLVRTRVGDWPDSAGHGTDVPAVRDPVADGRLLT